LIRPLFIVWNHLKPFEQFAVCTESVFWTLNRLVPTEVHYMEKKCWNVFTKNLNFFSTEERMTWTSRMTWGWVNYQQKFFQKWTTSLRNCINP